MKESFEQRFQALLDRLGLSTYKLALSIADDPSRIDQILFKKRPVKFEKRLETLEQVAKSPLLDVDFETLAYWLALDYLPEKVFIRALADRMNPETAQQAATLLKNHGLDEILEMAIETQQRRQGSQSDA